jgi:hypothetical protein
MEEITEVIPVIREEQILFVYMSQSGHNEMEEWITDHRAGEF